MQLLIAGAITLSITTIGYAAPPSNTPADTAPTPIIDPNTLERLAEQSLRTQGLSESTPATELWPATVTNTMEAIEARHRLQSLESSMKTLQSQIEELRRFVEDHTRYGDNFASYRALMDETKKLTDAQIALKRTTEKIERDRKREVARNKREDAVLARKNAKASSQRLEKLGFSAIGQDVYLSKSAYVYASRTVPDKQVYYQPRLSLNGELQQMTTIEDREEMDYSKMTISGSLLNAAKFTRNIGVAFVFRDEHGNQIGHETVVIENARADVPYPFTGELVMASSQPFTAMTSWVLFADTAPPAITTTPVVAPVPPGTPATP
jgi:hypothetical protein